MITKFKIYENINEGEPQVGDYFKIVFDKEINNDYINTIWQIDNIEPGIFGIKTKMMNDQWEVFDRSEIEYWSKNKKDLETLLIGNKYNL